MTFSLHISHKFLKIHQKCTEGEKEFPIKSIKIKRWMSSYESGGSGSFAQFPVFCQTSLAVPGVLRHCTAKPRQSRDCAALLAAPDTGNVQLCADNQIYNAAVEYQNKNTIVQPLRQRTHRMYIVRYYRHKCKYH